MAERIIQQYLRLLEVRILHHYWLDEGGTTFDDIESEDERQRRLLTYDVRTFLSVTPTPATAALLAGLNGVFKTTGLGFVVAIPEATTLPDAPVFEFVIKITSQDFFHYTALTMRGQQIQAFYHQPTDRTYRYKSGVYAFGNDTGTQKNGVNYLSRDILAAAGTYPAESLASRGGALHQAIRDDASSAVNADWQALDSGANWPLYIHQGDVPPIVPPAGLTGAPARGIELTEGIPDDVFALVRIVPFTIGNPMGLLAAPDVLSEPVFELRFKNRSTHRMYFNKNTGAFINSHGEALHPLTHRGNDGAHQKPEPRLTKPVLDAGGHITRINSEIFI